MRSALSDAVARCHARRLHRTVAAAPLPAAIVVILVVLAPLALARIGGAVGGELAGAVHAGGVADGIVLGPMLAAAVAGSALAVSLPGRSALGPQVAAGPVGDVVAITAGLVVPVLIGALTVVPSLLAVCVTLGGRLPGGRVAGLALACAIIAAVPAGAAVAEAALAAFRGRRRRALVIAGGVLGWASVGAVAGAVPLGPLALVPAALRGSGPAWIALAGASGTSVLLALAWLMLAAARPEQRSRATRPRRRIVRGGRPSIPLAVAVLLARRDDVRLGVASALSFGAAGIVIATAASADAPTPFLLATTTALLGSIVWPLAVCGVLLRGSWLWFGGAADARAVGRTAFLVGLAGSALPVVVVGVAAAASSGASGSAVGVVAAFGVVGSAAALQAGALVPWSGEGVGDQLTTFAAFTAIAVATSLAVGLVAPRLVALGLPDAVVVVLVGVASLGAAYHAVGRRCGAPG